MSTSKRPSNHLILLLLFLIIAGLVMQGIMISKLYIDANPKSRLIKISERVGELENEVKEKIRKSPNSDSKEEKSEPASPAVDSEPPQWRERMSEHFKEHDEWHPFQEMEQMRGRIDELFSNSMERFRQLPGFESSWVESFFIPDADFREMEDNYLVKMDLPGVGKDDLAISIETDYLTVAGKRSATAGVNEADKVHRAERQYGEFRRTFKIPGGIKAGEVRAAYENGVLTITIPKGEDYGVSRKIEVQ